MILVIVIAVIVGYKLNTMKNHCEHQNCQRKVVGRAKKTTSGKWYYLCPAHLAEYDALRNDLRGMSTLRQERRNEEYRKKEMGLLGEVIYNREISFSEKIDLLHL